MAGTALERAEVVGLGYAVSLRMLAGENLSRLSAFCSLDERAAGRARSGQQRLDSRKRIGLRDAAQAGVSTTIGLIEWRCRFGQKDREIGRRAAALQRS